MFSIAVLLEHVIVVCCDFGVDHKALIGLQLKISNNASSPTKDVPEM